MHYKFKKKLNKIKAWHLILLFFILNLIFLTNFPFVHSDEAWLSGLSRQILEQKTFKTTETFFDLLPRHPHAIKAFFHSIQIIFIKLFTYNIFSFRLISLISGSLSLFIFYKISYLITKSKSLSLASIVILAVEIQFIYSSHLARQEIILVLIMLIAIYYFLKEIYYQKKYISNFNFKKYHSNLKDIILAIILGTAIGFHPNALIISLPMVLIYSWSLFFKKEFKLKNYFSFMATLAFIALIFVYLSYSLDPNFFSNYLNYGANLGVLNSFLLKFKNLKIFYLKLFYQISGTYYLPLIKFQLLFFLIISIIASLKLFFKKDQINLYLILSIIGINLGFLLIGRYNQTSIIFIFPLYYLLFINLSKNLRPKLVFSLISILIICLTVNSGIVIYNDSHHNYQNYLNQIGKVIPANAKVLANLNTDYYFENGSLIDYRNLAFLAENNISFAEYITKNKIEYIIYPEEMDFIYNSRPQWNILYGNLYPFYSQLQTFLEKEAKLVKSFTNSTYGMRITPKIGEKEWKIKIYKVQNKADF